MTTRLGQRFYFTPDDMPASSKDHDMFIKYGMTEFSSFPTLEQFYKWFVAYRSHCKKKNQAFKIFELIMDGRPTAFYADIEGTSPLDTGEDELLMIRHVMKDVFRKKYALVGGNPDNLIWMEDHRESDGLHKTSFHVIGRDRITTDVKNLGTMRRFAEKLNNMITPEILGMNMNISFLDKKGIQSSVLDMRVYHSKRALRTIYSSKKINARGFILCEECKYRDFRDCFANLNMSPDEIEERFLIKVENVSDKRSGTSHPKHASRAHEVIPQDATPAHEATMKRIEHILSTEYNHRLTGIKFTGVYKGRDQYRIDGIRECPVCEMTHDSNGAFVSDLENGQFLYKCLTEGPCNTRKACITSRNKDTGPAEPEENEYLQSLLGIEQKCVSVTAPMGVGKTYQLVEYLKSLPPDVPVVWLTPRVAMVASLLGRLYGLGFKSYKETTMWHRLIMEIESFHKVCMQFPVVIMDEPRSLMTSLMSYETNGDYLLDHVNDLKEMCQFATRVFIVGADINIDGAVPAFIKDVFEEDQIFRIVHKSSRMSWNHVLMWSEVFYERLYKSISEGERIIVTCGASSDLKEIEIAASRIIERKKILRANPSLSAHDLEILVSTVETCSEVGAYHAECEIKHEIEDVNTHWAKYQVILYTSCITVSVDYQGEIDRVFCLPSISTANDREFDQMNHRGRNNNAREVIVRYDGPVITPRKNNDDLLFNREMSRTMTRRKYVDKTMGGYELQIARSIVKKGFGYQATYSPTLATELDAWVKVEEHKKVHDWYGSYLALLKAKGRTWEFGAIKPEEPTKTPLDTEVNTLETRRKELVAMGKERVDRAKQVRASIRTLPLEERKEARSRLKSDKDALDQALVECRSELSQRKDERKKIEEETPPSYVEASKKRKADIRQRETHALDKVDALGETKGSLERRKKRKYASKATSQDHLVLKKDEAQKYFPDSLSGEDVVFFNRHKRAILNRALYTKYPKIVRHKIHANSIEMSIASDYVHMDIKMFDVLDSIVSELGLESITDTSPFDWEAMVKAGEAGKISSALDAMDGMTGKDHSCSTDLTRLRHYFKILGYNVSGSMTRTRHNGTRTSYRKYVLSDQLGDMLERPNSIMDLQWLGGQCEEYDLFVLKKHYRKHREADFMKKHGIVVVST